MRQCVTQFVSTSNLGTKGHRFESCHLDVEKNMNSERDNEDENY